MKGILFSIVLLYIIALPLTPSAWAADKAEEAGVIDTRSTLHLFMEWEERKTFPDSMPFAYYHAYALMALQGKVQPEVAEKITAFILSCQTRNGGFAVRPALTQNPNILFTYYAIKTLDLLDKINLVDKNKIIRYTLSLQQDDGGIKGSSTNGDAPNLATTCYGIEVLKQLGAIDSLEKEKTVAFINRYRENGAGFGVSVGHGSTPEASFLGLNALETLDALTAQTREELSTYFLGTRYAGLIKDKKYKTLPKLKTMSFTLDGLHALGNLDKADRAAITAFVESLYIPENGGFGPMPGLGTTPASTFYGVVCLVHLGLLPEPAAATREQGNIKSKRINGLVSRQQPGKTHNK